MWPARTLGWLHYHPILNFSNLTQPVANPSRCNLPALSPISEPQWFVGRIISTTINTVINREIILGEEWATTVGWLMSAWRAFTGARLQSLIAQFRSRGKPSKTARHQKLRPAPPLSPPRSSTALLPATKWDAFFLPLRGMKQGLPCRPQNTFKTWKVYAHEISVVKLEKLTIKPDVIVIDSVGYV